MKKIKHKLFGGGKKEPYEILLTKIASRSGSSPRPGPEGQVGTSIDDVMVAIKHNTDQTTTTDDNGKAPDHLRVGWDEFVRYCVEHPKGPLGDDEAIRQAFNFIATTTAPTAPTEALDT